MTSVFLRGGISKNVMNEVEVDDVEARLAVPTSRCAVARPTHQVGRVHGESPLLTRGPESNVIGRGANDH
jgi:hypothetical protein